MIYLDHNASTPVREEVAALLVERFTAAPGAPGNASSVHRGGRDARARLDAARANVAALVGAEPKEVVFTGSGSEADAIALKGAFLGRTDLSKKRLVVSSIEHPALTLSAKHLESLGAQLVHVAPGPDGRVRAEDFAAQLTPDTVIASLMWANNETGVIQPVREVAQLCRQRGILFHTDAVQAAGKIPVTLRECDADLLSLSAHKFGGPLGVGALVVRRGVKLMPLTPGHQETGLRGGSSNVVYAEALALALELATRTLDEDAARISALRHQLERACIERLPGVTVNGGSAPRVPNTTNLRFEGADGEAVLIALDLEGICISAGAACASGTLTPSPVLTAMGLTPKQAHASLRISLGRQTTSDDVERAIDALARHVPAARRAG